MARDGKKRANLHAARISRAAVIKDNCIARSWHSMELTDDLPKACTYQGWHRATKRGHCGLVFESERVEVEVLMMINKLYKDKQI